MVEITVELDMLPYTPDNALLLCVVRFSRTLSIIVEIPLFAPKIGFFFHKKKPLQLEGGLCKTPLKPLRVRRKKVASKPRP